MLASTRPNQGKRGRRGIVLVLILGMLALMALIGVTFATFSGQSRISARNFAQSMNQPQRDELMDFALSQLISDTADIRSAIRGHSMARDMYGNDAQLQRLPHLPPRTARPQPPDNDPYFYITGVSSVGTGTLYNLTTNIPAGDPAFYGYNFTRWMMRLTYIGAPTAPGTGVVDQTLEILADNLRLTAYRVFTVNMAPTDQATVLSTSTPDPYAEPTDSSPTGYPNGHYTPAPGLLPRQRHQNLPLHPRRPLAARFQRPGHDRPTPCTRNFRYNGLSAAHRPGIRTVGMDEDYDAVDLENWFLAMQSADGSVIIPSFHRPAAIRIDLDGHARDLRLGRAPERSLGARGAGNWADSASRILRPRAADGHDATTFPDLVPDATGKITYDVDNDGDGDHRLGLGRPGLPGPPQRAGPALQAAVRVHGHRPQRPDPAEHGGNLAGQTAESRSPGHAPVHLRRRRGTRASTWATRSARSTRPTRSRTGYDPELRRRRGASTIPPYGPSPPSIPRWTTPASTSG